MKWKISSEFASKGEEEMTELYIQRLYEILEEHWCNDFPYSESCKHCDLELKICAPLDKFLQSYTKKARNDG